MGPACRWHKEREEWEADWAARREELGRRVGPRRGKEMKGEGAGLRKKKREREREKSPGLKSERERTRVGFAFLKLIQTIQFKFEFKFKLNIKQINDEKQHECNKTTSFSFRIPTNYFFIFFLY